MPIADNLARNGIRDMTMAPGIFGTSTIFGMPQHMHDALATRVPFPIRRGSPADHAGLVTHITEDDTLNGEVIRLDGAIRPAPKQAAEDRSLAVRATCISAIRICPYPQP